MFCITHINNMRHCSIRPSIYQSSISISPKFIKHFNRVQGVFKLFKPVLICYRILHSPLRHFGLRHRTFAPAPRSQCSMTFIQLLTVSAFLVRGLSFRNHFGLVASRAPTPARRSWFASNLSFASAAIVSSRKPHAQSARRVYPLTGTSCLPTFRPARSFSAPGPSASFQLTCTAGPSARLLPPLPS